MGEQGLLLILMSHTIAGTKLNTHCAAVNDLQIPYSC